jgi:hypothetical protein
VSGLEPGGPSRAANGGAFGDTGHLRLHGLRHESVGRDRRDARAPNRLRSVGPSEDTTISRLLPQWPTAPLARSSATPSTQASTLSAEPDKVVSRWCMKPWRTPQSLSAASSAGGQDGRQDGRFPPPVWPIGEAPAA